MRGRYQSPESDDISNNPMRSAPDTTLVQTIQDGRFIPEDDSECSYGVVREIRG